MTEAFLVSVAASIMMSRFPRVALGMELIVLAWLIYFQGASRTYGFPSVEVYRSPVTIFYIMETLLLVFVLVGFLRSRSRKPQNEVKSP